MKKKKSKLNKKNIENHKLKKKSLRDFKQIYKSGWKMKTFNIQETLKILKNQKKINHKKKVNGEKLMFFNSCKQQLKNIRRMVTWIEILTNKYTTN